MRGAVVNSPHSLLIAEVSHRRAQPKVHAFRYHVYYLSVALSALKQLGCGILSFERFNLMSYREADHGNPKIANETWIRQVLKEWSLSEVTTGEIMLVTMPRILGYAFNPVSFWFCLDGEGGIRAVLSEVNNTFGEKHCYLSYHDDRHPIGPDDWMVSEKVFHVSPYLTVEGTYRYRFIFSEKRVAVWINHDTSAGEMIATSLIARRIPLNSRNLLRCFFRYPLVTFKVIALIYWHAIRLLAKGLRYHRKPRLGAKEITR